MMMFLKRLVLESCIRFLPRDHGNIDGEIFKETKEVFSFRWNGSMNLKDKSMQVITSTVLLDSRGGILVESLSAVLNYRGRHFTVHYYSLLGCRI